MNVMEKTKENPGLVKAKKKMEENAEFTHI